MIEISAWILTTILVLFCFLVPIILIIYAVYGIWADFLGAPYVPTNGKFVEEILEEAKLKKGQTFVELGSGDGRIIREAVKKYGVKGVGVEIHLLLIWYSRLMSKYQNLKNIEFLQKNFFKVDLKKTDVLFLFLLPKTLTKLKEKILKECKKGTLIISHGFKIEGFEKYLIKKQERKLFPTYFYRI